MGHKRLFSIFISCAMAVGLLVLALVFIFTFRPQTVYAQGGSICGTVTYYGTLSGTHDIWVAIYTDTQSGSPRASYPVASPVSTYTFSLSDDGTYYVSAYLDVDGSGGAPGVNEPFAWHDADGDGSPDPVVVANDAAVGGIDIALTDPWRPLTRLLGQVNDLTVGYRRNVTGSLLFPSPLYAAVGVPGDGERTRVYRSLDGSASWQLVYTGSVNTLNGLAGLDDLALAVGEGTNGRGVIVRSADGGVTWRQVFTGAGQDSGGFRAVAIDPVVTTTAYAAGAELSLPNYEGYAVVYRSADGGLTWQRALSITAGPAWADLLALAVNPVTPSIIYAGGYESEATTRYAAVYRSTDGGDHWTRVLTATEGAEQQFTSLLVHPLTPTVVFAGSQNPKYVYRSADGGLTWEPVRYDRGFRLDLVPPDTVYTTDDWREIDRSTVGGITGTWSKVGSDTPGDIRAFAIDHASATPDLYLGFKFEGVYRSADGGAPWEERNAGIESPLVVRDVAVDPQNRQRLFAAAGCDGGWMSADGGQNWVEAPGADCVHAFAVDPSDGAVVYAGVEDEAGATGAVWRSANGGLSFGPVYSESERMTALAVAPTAPGTVYAAGWDGGASGYGLIVRSTDGGATWTRTFTRAGLTVQTLAVDPADADIAYAGGADCSAGPCVGVVYRTADGVGGWDRVLEFGTSINSVVVDPQKPDVLYASDDLHVHKSVDGGASWDIVQAYAESNLNLLAIDPRVPSHVYLAGPGRIVETTDGGATWSDFSAPINQGTERMNATALAVDTGAFTQTLYAGFTGLWHYTRPAPRPGRPATVTAWSDLPGAPTGAEIAVHARVVDQHENWVADGTVVTFTVSPGYSFDGFRTVTRTTTDGQAQVALVGLVAGRATITVTAGSGISDTVAVEFAVSTFTNERVLRGLSQPTVIDWTPDGRMFIGHQDGRVLVYADGELLDQPFIDLSDEVNNNWNRGMLGLAIHPSFPITPYVYLLYTYDPPELPGYDNAVDGKDGWGSRVSRLVQVSADPATDYTTALTETQVIILGKNSTYVHIGDAADPGGERGVPACVQGTQPLTDCLPSEGPSHSIGMLAFDHDGALLVSNGEGVPYITPDPRATRAQDLDSLGGKVLRIDPETGLGLPDNPFYDGNPTSNRSRVWAYGMRNPFRFALHPVTDTLYVGDVGWFSWEEINTGRAQNFGWPCYEGGDSGNVRHPSYQWYTPTLGVCQPLYDAEPNNEVKAPLYAYANVSGAAVVPGAIYTGTTYPEQYRDVLFFADYHSRWIKYLTFEGDGSVARHDFLENVSNLGAPVHLTLGPDGYLYFVALNPDPNGESEIRRIIYTTAPSAQAEATPTNGYTPLEVHFSAEGSIDSNYALSELSFEWDFGDGEQDTGVTVTHTYQLTGTYTAVLTATNPQGASDTDEVLITVGNLAPAATISAPVTGTLYTMSGTVPFEGIGYDEDDGEITTSEQLAWNAWFDFRGHFHSPFASQQGTAGSFVVPSHNDDNSVVLCLTVRDSGGLQDTACVNIYPRTADYHFDTDPSGLQLVYDGVYYTAPFTIPMIVNAQRTIAAPIEQAGLTFAEWSDGGARSHVIVGTASEASFVATYRRFVWLPLVLRSG